MLSVLIVMNKKTNFVFYVNLIKENSKAGTVNNGLEKRTCII